MARKRQNPLFSASAIRNISLGFIGTLLVVFFIRGIMTSAETSGLFRVKEIAISDGLGSLDVPELSKLKGRSIFSVDLDRISAKIKSKYPEVAGLKVLRQYPDTISVSGTKRVPFALAALNGKILGVDRDGFLTGAVSAEVQDGLTVIKGLKPGKAVVGGTSIADARFEAAVKIINAFKKDDLLSAVPLNSVDVSDFSKMPCHVGSEEADLDVIIDTKSLPSKAHQLGTLLSRSEVDLKNIKYIDLRFAEPIIGQRKVKK